MINFTVHYFALSGMARANFPGFATEGALWFTNLSIPDPIFLLPAITASTFFLANLHWNNEDRAEVKVAIASDSRIKYMFGIAKYAPPVVIFTVAAYMPSAICLHWASSNATHLARELLYKSETIKRLTSAPDLRRFKEKEHGVVSSHHEFMDGDSLNRPDLSKEVR